MTGKQRTPANVGGPLTMRFLYGFRRRSLVPLFSNDVIIPLWTKESRSVPVVGPVTHAI